MSDMGIRVEKDSVGEASIPADRVWGAQTQRSLEHFRIGTDLMPREMFAAYAILKKGAAKANYADNHLTLKVAALKLGFVSDEEFDRVVDPIRMVNPYEAEPVGE
jgi:fumarate hydratase class II